MSLKKYEFAFIDLSDDNFFIIDFCCSEYFNGWAVRSNIKKILLVKPAEKRIQRALAFRDKCIVKVINANKNIKL